MCSSYRSNKNPQTVKLSTPSSVNHLTAISLRARYVSVLTPMRPNRPHIPSTNNRFKERSSDKQNEARSLPSDPRPPCLQIFRTLPAAFAPVRFRHRRCFASVRRYLRKPPETRKRENRPLSHYFRKPRFIHNILGLADQLPLSGDFRRNIVSPGFAGLRSRPASAGRS